MARLRDKVPLHEDKRFLQRCAKEEEKLCLVVATQLQDDMKRLFEEEILADLTVKVKSSEIKLHKFVINSRSPEIYKQMCHVAVEADDNILTMPDWVDGNDLKKACRGLYTTKDRSFDDFIIYSKDLDSNTALVMDVLGALKQRIPSVTSDTEKENINPDVSVEDFESKENTTEIDKVSSVQSATKNTEIKSADSVVIDDVKPVEMNVENNLELISTNEISDGTNENPEDNVNVVIEDSMKNTELTKCDQVGESLPDLIKMSYDLSLPHKTCDSLGEALLRGHLKELDCDCTIIVSGAKFEANRCILAARSSYFSSMFSGSWIESEDREIHMEEISPPVMEQILLYLYGGVMEIDPYNTFEIVKAGDMYGMEGLNTLVNYNLRKSLCHFFHRPCSECESGVIETLKLCDMYNMPDLRDKCLKWINAHMDKVWRNKSFAALSSDVLDLCCNAAIKDLSIHCVLETMLDCQKLNRNIPRLKWSEPVLTTITRLMDTAIEFTASHFYRLLNSSKFVDIDKSLAYQMGLLEEIFDTVIKSLPVSGACQVFHRLCELREATQEEFIFWSEEFCQFIHSLYNMCESFMKLHIHQLAHTKDWDVLSKDVQTQLMKSANYVCIDGISRDRKAPPKLSSMQKDKRTSADVIKTLREQKHIPKMKTNLEKPTIPVRSTGAMAKPRKPNMKPSTSQGDKKLSKGNSKQEVKTAERPSTSFSEIHERGDNCSSEHIASREMFDVSLPPPVVFTEVLHPVIQAVVSSYVTGGTL